MHASSRRLVVAVVVACLAGCAQSTNTSAVDAAKEMRQAKVDKEKSARMLNDARTLLEAGRAAEAITKDLDPVIAAFDAAYADTKAHLYSARSLPETIFYLASPTARTAVPGTPPGAPSAIVVDSAWATALYLKGYASIELRQFRQAHEALERAVALAPMNAQYLWELGQLHLVEKNWAQASSYFDRAADATQISPPDLKDKELASAWRGKAYADIEVGQVDAAIALYEKCLKLNPDDAVAAKELMYARGRRRDAMK